MPDDHRIFSILLAPVLLGLAVGNAFPQAATTIWNGVYTEAQADRGEVAYEARCSSCHREGPINIDVLVRDWSGTTLDALFEQIRTTMPKNAPGTLTDNTYADILAYVLHSDSVPVGTRELTADTLQAIRVEPKEGPGVVPNYSLVSVVGCLALQPDLTWSLKNAGELERTKDPAASKGDELEKAQDQALGTQTIQLMSVSPKPDAYNGHRVQAKGLLIREPQRIRLNVMSVQSLSPDCDSPK
jgi:mono/diheme cytochrome c family protein